MAYQKLQGYRAALVVPSDTDNIPSGNGATDSTAECVLYIGVGGVLRVLTAGNDDVTFINVIAGSFFPINVKRVFATDTTATDIVAIW